MSGGRLRFEGPALEQLRAAARHAHATTDRTLAGALGQLRRLAGAGGEAVVYSDFAPLSFGFTILHGGRPWISGGVIYHGAHDGHGSGQGPTFAVTLDASTGWRIHT